MSKHSKICVIGPPGSGKSTIAKNVATVLGLHYIELDSLVWEHGWHRIRDEALVAKLTPQLKDSGWVADGMYQDLLDVLNESADLIIFMKTGLLTCVYRVLKRSLRRIISKEILWNANTESLKTLLKPNGMFWYTFKSYNWYKNNLRRFPQQKLIKCTSFNELRNILES